MEEATTSVSISLPSKKNTEESRAVESDYNVELGVYHENEISGGILKCFENTNKNIDILKGQKTLSPKPVKKSFKSNKRKVASQ